MVDVSRLGNPSMTSTSTPRAGVGKSEGTLGSIHPRDDSQQPGNDQRIQKRASRAILTSKVAETSRVDLRGGAENRRL